jgi:hypothetical protein
VNRKHSAKQENIQYKPTLEPEIDYSPKTYTIQEQIVFGVKLILAAGIIMFLFWLVGK